MLIDNRIISRYSSMSRFLSVILQLSIGFTHAAFVGFMVYLGNEDADTASVSSSPLATNIKNQCPDKAALWPLGGSIVTLVATLVPLLCLSIYLCVSRFILNRSLRTSWLWSTYTKSSSMELPRYLTHLFMSISVVLNVISILIAALYPSCIITRVVMSCGWYICVSFWYTLAIIYTNRHRRFRRDNDAYRVHPLAVPQPAQPAPQQLQPHPVPQEEVHQNSTTIVENEEDTNARIVVINNNYTYAINMTHQSGADE